MAILERRGAIRSFVVGSPSKCREAELCRHTMAMRNIFGLILDRCRLTHRIAHLVRSSHTYHHGWMDHSSANALR